MDKRALFAGLLEGLGGHVLDSHDQEAKDARRQKELQLDFVSKLAGRDDLTDEGQGFLLNSMSTLMGAKKPEELQAAWTMLQKRLGEKASISMGSPASARIREKPISDQSGWLQGSMAQRTGGAFGGTAPTPTGYKGPEASIPELPQVDITPATEPSQTGGLFRNRDVEMAKARQAELSQFQEQERIRASMKPDDWEKAATGLDANGNVQVGMLNPRDGATRVSTFSGLSPLPTRQSNPTKTMQLEAAYNAQAAGTATPGQLAMIRGESSRQQLESARQQFIQTQASYIPKRMAIMERNSITSEGNLQARLAGQDVEMAKLTDDKHMKAVGFYNKAEEFNVAARTLEEKAPKNEDGTWLDPNTPVMIERYRTAAAKNYELANQTLQSEQRAKSVTGRAQNARPPLRPGSPGRIRQQYYETALRLANGDVEKAKEATRRKFGN